jgi:hypothetical protein
MSLFKGSLAGLALTGILAIAHTAAFAHLSGGEGLFRSTLGQEQLPQNVQNAED